MDAYCPYIEYNSDYDLTEDTCDDINCHLCNEEVCGVCFKPRYINLYIDYEEQWCQCNIIKTFLNKLYWRKCFKEWVDRSKKINQIFYFQQERYNYDNIIYLTSYLHFLPNELIVNLINLF